MGGGGGGSSLQKSFIPLGSSQILGILAVIWSLCGLLKSVFSALSSDLLWSDQIGTNLRPTAEAAVGRWSSGVQLGSFGFGSVQSN